MKHYLLSAVLIVVCVVASFAIPFGVSLSEDFLASLEIPNNNSAVAGIQIYNTPPLSRGLPLPVFSARAILVKDLNTGTILYQKNADVALPIASTTKIMTSLVGSEFFKSNSILTIGDSSKVIGSKVGLVYGETLSFRSLLYGMLLNSGNDASFAIAENYPGGVLGFVSAMNKKVIELGLKNTHFDNPAGFDSPKHFSSAGDLGTISEEALKDPNLARIFATKDTQVLSIDKKYKHDLKNLNKLLTSLTGVLGIKTGYTEGAKENLVTLVNRNNHKILSIVLGSDDRFGETTKLVEWVYYNYQWSDLVSR